MQLFIPEDVKEIGKILNNNNFECYLVGGAIRNQLLGKEAKDFDLTTNAKPEEVIKLFKRVIPTGIKHGTVTILIGNNSYEITTYRIDGKYSDGRRPDKIQFTPSIEEDLIRRDFTINSIAFNLKSNTFLDINSGIVDLENRTIRAIGIPSKRFEEDALRLVRACRFASQLNFSIEKLTYIAMSQTLGKLKDVSKERISDELIKILNSKRPSIAFDHFKNCGMLEILFPTFYMSTLSNNLYCNALIDLDSIETIKPYIKFARLLAITPEVDHLKTLKDLKLSNDFISSTLNLVKFINYDLSTYDNDYMIRVLISEVGEDNIEDLLILWSGMHGFNNNKLDTVKNIVAKVIKSRCPFKVSDLNITGNDIINILDIKPGPSIGNLLTELLALTLKDPNLNKKEILIEKCRELS